MTDRTRRCCRRTRIYRPSTHALLPLTAPLTPPGEHHGRIYTTAPAIHLDATGAFRILSGTHAQWAQITRPWHNRRRADHPTRSKCGISTKNWKQTLMKSVYWLALVVLAALYVKYYYVIGPRLLLLLASVYAGRFLLNRLHHFLSGSRDAKAEETNRANAVDAEYEIVDDEKK